MNKNLTVKNICFSLFIILALPACAATDDLELRARGIHDRVMTLDSHVDIPFNFATSEHDPATDEDAQVNLDRMLSGGLDSAFFIVYVGQDARTEASYLAAKADAFAKFDAIHRMTDILYSDVQTG